LYSFLGNAYSALSKIFNLVYIAIKMIFYFISCRLFLSFILLPYLFSFFLLSLLIFINYRAWAAAFGGNLILPNSTLFSMLFITNLLLWHIMDLKILPQNAKCSFGYQFLSIPVIYSTNCLICFNCAPPPVGTIRD
jgi:hypothetical protein